VVCVAVSRMLWIGDSHTNMVGRGVCVMCVCGCMQDAVDRG